MSLLVHAGTCPTAAASAMRARPCGVACASATTFSHCSVALFTSLGMLTMGSEEPGASSVLRVNAMSRRVFQNEREPASAPQCGRAPANRSGYFCATPAATSAPSEVAPDDRPLRRTELRGEDTEHLGLVVDRLVDVPLGDVAAGAGAGDTAGVEPLRVVGVEPVGVEIDEDGAVPRLRLHQIVSRPVGEGSLDANRIELALLPAR